MKYDYIATSMAKNWKITTIPNSYKDVEQLEFSYITDINASWNNYFLNEFVNIY